MSTFKVKKLSSGSYTVIVKRSHNLIKVELPIYEVSGQAIGGPTAKQSATRLARDLNRTLALQFNRQ